MRKIGPLHCLVFFCLLSFTTSASAEIKQFKHFQADVPDGWTAVEKPGADPSTVVMELKKEPPFPAPQFDFFSKSEVSSLELTIVLQENNDAKTSIEKLHEEYDKMERKLPGGQPFKKVEYGDGGYGNYRTDGKNVTFFAFCRLGDKLIIYIYGQGPNFNEAEIFLKSIKSFDAALPPAGETRLFISDKGKNDA